MFFSFFYSLVLTNDKHYIYFHFNQNKDMIIRSKFSNAKWYGLCLAINFFGAMEPTLRFCVTMLWKRSASRDNSDSFGLLFLALYSRTCTKVEIKYICKWGQYYTKIKHLAGKSQFFHHTGFFYRNVIIKLSIFQPKYHYFSETKYVLKRLLWDILKNKCSL